MFKNNKEKQTNERKTFKEFVSDNRGKIMVIGGTVVTITAGIKGFDKMLDQCDELEYLYKCRTIGENLLDD